MATITCDATSSPPNRVASPSNISVYVGNPPRELLIYSGVAIPEWESLSDLDWADVIVTLGPATTPLFSYTSTATLASITNTDSDLVFAVDQTTVVNGPTGLELRAHIGVKGEKSLFSRFSYHVQVLTDKLTTTIAGTIRWSSTLSNPTPEATIGSIDTFRVAAGSFVPGPGSASFATTVWEEQASTLVSTPPVLAGGFWAVPYTLVDLPLGVQLQVVPALLGGMLTPPIAPTFFPTPRLVTLTPDDPSAVGIDFELLDGSGTH